MDDFGIITIAGGIPGYFSSNRRGNDDIYRFDAESGTKPLAETARDSSSVSGPIVKAIVPPSMPSPDISFSATAESAGAGRTSQEGLKQPGKLAAQPVTPHLYCNNHIRIR